MTYTTVPTYTTNQLVTSSHANTYWRDNLNALFPHTAAGDLAYASAATVLSRLEIGAAGKRLGSDGSVPSWLYGAPLLAYGIDTITSKWTSTTVQAFQDTPLSVDLSLAVAGIVVALFSGSVQSNSSSYNVLYRMMVDDEGGTTHVGLMSNATPGSCMYIKTCNAGTITCKVQAYGYLSATGAIDDGELIAFAFPAA
jgi:hypothetical protein